MDCERAGELLPAYALNALDGGDIAEVESHLGSCPMCRLALDQHREVVQQLSRSVTLLEPPPDLKGRLMARVEQYEADRGERRQRRRLPRIAFSLGFLRPRRSHVVVAMGSLAAIALGLVGWTVYQTFEVKDLQDRNQRLTTDVQRQWDALSFASNARVESVQLVSNSTSTRGSLLVDFNRNRAAIMIKGLPPAPKGLVYELWCTLDDGSLINMGPLPVSDGYVTWVFDAPYPISSLHSWGVTQEPIGSSAPNGRAILSADPMTVSFK